MNNSINYSGFVEMFLDSADDFEPYGCIDTPSLENDARPDGGTKHKRQASRGEEPSSD